MNIGISSYGQANPYSGYARADIVLPPARQAGLPAQCGSASVEVSLSPRAASLLTIDMDSLAAKGYTEVNIDTDGRPGAEISIKVQPGAGTVVVGAQTVAANLKSLCQSDEQDFLRLLLEMLKQVALAAKEQGANPESAMDALLRLLLGPANASEAGTESSSSAQVASTAQDASA